MSNNLIYIILGAPRSGLTPLAQSLRILGFTQLVNPDHPDPTTINTLLLQDLSLTPYNPAPLPKDWQNTNAATKAKDRIQKLLSFQSLTTNAEQPTPFISDPLLCRTLPLWLQVLRDNDIKYKCIHIVRHPWEVALSLRENENLDLQKAHITWLAYIRDTFRNCPKQNIITFDQLLADPVTSLGSAFSPTESSFIAHHSSLLEYIQPIFKQHHASDLPDEDKETYKPYEEIYQKIRAHQVSIGDFKGNASSAEQVESSQAAISNIGKIGEDSCKFVGSNSLIDNLLQAIVQQEITTNLQTPHSAKYHSQQTGFFAQIIFPSSHKEGQVTETIPLIDDQWEKISWTVPEPELLNNEPLGFSPLNCPGTVSIASINFLNSATNTLIATVQSFDDIDAIHLSGNALRIPSKDNLVIFITGSEPSLTVKVPVSLPDCPVQVEIWLKASQGLDTHKDLLASLTDLENWKLFLNTHTQNPNPAKLINLADVFEKVGCPDEADAVLNIGTQGQPVAEALYTAFAELAMKRRQWDEAVRRWQDIVALYGEKTPSQVYQRLDVAYKKQRAFPKGTQEEEARIGDGNKHEMLSLIHQILEPRLYLEIGVQAGKSLALAHCEAIGVDPMPQANSELHKKAHIIDKTSDDFFKTSAEKLLQNPPDLVFVDGMHLFEYALRDFINVERYSAPHTLVTIDDIFPSHSVQAERRRRTSAWAGDVWKLFEVLKVYRPDLFFLPINISPTGLLFIAGLDPENKILKDSYETIINEYFSELEPPEHILKRDGIFSSDHQAIPDVLRILKTARNNPLLKPESIVKKLKSKLLNYANSTTDTTD